MTVAVDSPLPDGTLLVLTGYTVSSDQSLPVTGPDVTVTVQADQPFALVKIDDPDGVVPGGTLTYTLTVSNRDSRSIAGLVLRELFDPNLQIVSTSPAADLGTTDRWSMPFLPAGGSRTVTIVATVKDTVVPGTILRNFAIVNDEIGRSAKAYEDTLVLDAASLTIDIDDLPDPVQPGSQVTYTISYANVSDQALTGVVIHATVDPRLTLVSSSPAADVGSDLSWTVGSMPATSTGLIFATFDVNDSLDDPPVTAGSLLKMRAWIDDDAGHLGSASEVTFTSDNSALRQYTLALTGAPRNLRIGVVTTEVYLINLRNIGAVDTTNVIVSDALPPGLQFSQSIPSPSSNSGGLLPTCSPHFPRAAPSRF